MNTSKKICLIVCLAILLVPAARGNMITVEPDAFADGTDISTAFSAVTLSPWEDDTTTDLLDYRVYARTASNPLHASTGTNVFGYNGGRYGNPQIWYNNDNYHDWTSFDVIFSDPVNYVAIDVINVGLNSGVLNAYPFLVDIAPPNTGMLGSISLSPGVHNTFVISSSSYDISKISFLPDEGTAVVIDNLRFNVVPIPSTIFLGILGLGVAGLKLRKFA